jgi:hypothetical protein
MPRFRSVNDAIRTFVENNPPRVVVPNSSPLATTFGSRAPNTQTVTSDILRWGTGCLWGVELVTPYVFPNQLTDPQGEWS